MNFDMNMWTDMNLDMNIDWHEFAMHCVCNSTDKVTLVPPVWTTCNWIIQTCITEVNSKNIGVNFNNHQHSLFFVTFQYEQSENENGNIEVDPLTESFRILVCFLNFHLNPLILFFQKFIPEI